MKQNVELLVEDEDGTSDCDMGCCFHRDCMEERDVDVAALEEFEAQIGPPRDCDRGRCGHEVCLGEWHLNHG